MWPALISAGANILGGILGKSSSDAANAAARDMAAQNIALQREFAQNGIQWRVEDAKKAGIHPIYALGSGGASFSPVSANFSADTSLPNALAAAGQDIGRAVDSTRTAADRTSARVATTLALEKAGLENDLLRAEIASKTGRLRQVTQPAMPAAVDPYLIPGQAQSGLVQGKPMEATRAPSNAPHSEGGAIPDVGWSRTSTGWSPVPSADVKQRIEDNLPQELAHAWRNNILPMIPGLGDPPPFAPEKGKVWRYNPLKWEWQQVTDRTHVYKAARRAVGRVIYGGR